MKPWAWLQFPANVLVNKMKGSIKPQPRAKQESANQEKPDSKKKQRPPLTKVCSTGTLFKKPDFKLPDQKRIQTKKEQSPASSKRTEKKVTPVHSANNSNSKSSAGSIRHGAASSSGASSKFLAPSLGVSSKSSLAEQHLKKTPQQKKKVEFGKVGQRQAVSAKLVKEQVKKSLAKVIKIYQPEKKAYLDVSLTEATSDGLVKEERMSRSDFNFMEAIGEGGYGRVWRVEHLKTRGIFAMKEMSKALIIMKKSVENVFNELKILTSLKSPFIANMAFAFHDRDNLYLGMDYLPGGDFRSFLAYSQRLKEDQVKFVAACIIKAIQYIHRNKIFHRDIKPQNLVLDERGYLRLTDFGIARSVKDKSDLDASGTPGYMAPEVICKQVHSYPVDFYALGIICFELMMGKRPYSGQNRAEIRDAILSKQHCLKKQDLPAGWSLESMDFINKLIMRQPGSRLGSKGGAGEVMQHPWMAKFAWKSLEQRKMESGLSKVGVQVEKESKMNLYDETVNQYKLLQRTDEKTDIFGGYFSNFR